jgi:PAS domain S-box-containing protein
MIAAQELLDFFLKNSSDGFLAFDKYRRYTVWNPTMEKISGLKAEQVVGNVAEIVFPFLVETGEIECFDRCFRGETMLTDIQTYKIPSSGKQGYFSAKYMPIRDASGEIIAGAAIIVEQTERVNRELMEKLHSTTEERVQTIFKYSPMGIQIYNQQGSCIYVNEHWERIFDSVRSELDGYNIFEDHQLAANGILDVIKRAFAGETIHSPPTFYDPKLIGKKGKPSWIESYTFPIRNEKNEVEVVIITIDATNMVESVRNKEESELKFKGIADALPVMVWVTDMEGNVEYINDRWFNYTGQKKEFSRETWITVVHPDDIENVLATQREALKTGGNFRVEYRIRDKDGNYHWFLGLTIMVRDDKGRPFKRFGTATNIEDQKRAVEVQRESVRSRDEFMSIASHELRTPLTSLALQNHIRFVFLRDKEPIGPELLESWFEKDAKQLSKLNRLIDDMLDVTRIKTGRLDLQLEVINIVDIINEVIDRFRPQLIEKCGGVTFKTEPKIEVCCDPFRIEQVITNLLTNGMKYGNNKPIHVSTHVASEMVEIMVHDQGIGIAPEDQERIFGRFERAMGSNQVSGLGLGLAIAKDIVEAHHGTITVVSDISKGSDFIIRLPLQQNL